MEHDETTVDALDQRFLTSKILWAAFLMTHVILSAVFWLARQPMSEEMPETLAHALAGIGILVPLGAHAMRTVVLDRIGANLSDHELTTLLQAYFVPMILSFAFAETGAMLGGVVLLLGFDPLYWAMPAAIGLLVHLTLVPTRRGLELWRDRLRSRAQ
jgi:hypothetical protein